MMKQDFTYGEGCGCTVTFFAASNFHSSQMLPGPECADHAGRYQVAERDCLVERAREALTVSKLIGRAPLTIPKDSK